MIVGRTKDFYLFDLLVYFLTSILKVTSWLQVQPSSRHSVQQESERRAGEQNISHTISRLLTNTRSMKARGSQTKPTKSENDF